MSPIKWFRSPAKFSRVLREPHASPANSTAQIFYNPFTRRSHIPGASHAKSSLMKPAWSVRRSHLYPLEVPMRHLNLIIITHTLMSLILLMAPAAVSAAESITNPTLAAPAADLMLREVHYEGQLTDTQAKFIVNIDVESAAKGEASATLFEGDVAVMPAKLPSGLRIVREGRQFRLVATRPGQYKFKLELVAKITRAEPWNQIFFVGPAASIASVMAQAAGEGIEVQLLSGTPLEPEKGESARVRGVLGSDRAVSLRWQTKTAEAAHKALITCDTAASAHITPTVIRFVTELRYDIVQGN